jgi:hypothetical protein
VPEHTELAWIFNTVTPLGELERQTQFKDKSQRMESVSAGLLNYPILQAADILLYRADRVPVGEDQLQHLELSRVIARRWNAEFAPDDDYFPEPQPVLTPTRRIMGLDGQSKMSKSMGNTIGLLESPEEIWAKLRPAVTDPKRIKRTDPGTPEVCNIYHLHKGVQPAGHGGARRHAVQHRRVGVHRLQEGAGRVDGERARADPRAGRGAARGCVGHGFRAGRGGGPVPHARARDASGGARTDGVRLKDTSRARAFVCISLALRAGMSVRCGRARGEAKQPWERAMQSPS